MGSPRVDDIGAGAPAQFKPPPPALAGLSPAAPVSKLPAPQVCSAGGLHPCWCVGRKGDTSPLLQPCHCAPQKLVKFLQKPPTRKYWDPHSASSSQQPATTDSIYTVSPGDLSRASCAPVPASGSPPVKCGCTGLCQGSLLAVSGSRHRARA